MPGFKSYKQLLNMIVENNRKNSWYYHIVILL
jgi:hypothetical protein